MDGHEKADELATMGADLHHQQRAEWDAEEHMNEIAIIDKTVKYAAYFQSHNEESTCMDALIKEEGGREPSTFIIPKRATWEDRPAKVEGRVYQMWDTSTYKKDERTMPRLQMANHRA